MKMKTEIRSKKSIILSLFALETSPSFQTDYLVHRSVAKTTKFSDSLSKNKNQSSARYLKKNSDFADPKHRTVHHVNKNWFYVA